jgi:acetyl esterase
MNWKLRSLLWFVNNVQPIRSIENKEIENERKRLVRVSGLGKFLFDKKIPIRAIKNFKIEGIPVRLYNQSEHENKKVIFFIHGGGFVFYNIDSHDYVCRRLCDMNDCVVISIDYRLAPEHSFPAAHDDVFQVIEYVAKNAAKLGIDAQKIIVAGDSAGGNIAACASHHFRNHTQLKIAAQVLIYPWIDGKLQSNSIEKYSQGYLLTKEAMIWFQQQYIPNVEDRLNPLVSPIYHKEFNQLAPAFILTAEYDLLKEDGIVYAEKLKQHGNVVLYKDYPKLIHGFFNIPKIATESMQAYYDIQAFLKKVV